MIKMSVYYLANGGSERRSKSLLRSERHAVPLIEHRRWRSIPAWPIAPGVDLRRLLQRRPGDRASGALRALGVDGHPCHERPEERAILRVVGGFRGDLRPRRPGGLASRTPDDGGGLCRGLPRRSPGATPPTPRGARARDGGWGRHDPGVRGKGTCLTHLGTDCCLKETGAD